MIKYMQEEKVHQFLMGLDDDSYSIVHSQILVMDPLPSIDKIFNMVQQEENHKRMMSDRDQRSETMAAYATSHITRPVSMQGERMNCKHSGKIGHK